MKKIAMILVMMALVVGLSSVAHALPFTDIVNFGSTGINDNEASTNDFWQLRDNNPAANVYTHTVLFDPIAVSVDSAMLTLMHKGSESTSGEVWLVNVESLDPSAAAISLGKLDPSYKIWVKQEFPLSSPFYSGIMNANEWEIQIALSETSSGDDGVKLAWSKLSGEYSTVPEPATLILFGSGLAGFAVRRKRA